MKSWLEGKKRTPQKVCAMFFDKDYSRDEPNSEHEMANQVPHQFHTNLP